MPSNILGLADKQERRVEAALSALFNSISRLVISKISEGVREERYD